MCRQMGLVNELMEEFKMLASQILVITDQQHMGLFMGGLKEEIRMEVQTPDPPNRYKVVSKGWSD